MPAGPTGLGPLTPYGNSGTNLLFSFSVPQGTGVPPDPLLGLGDSRGGVHGGVWEGDCIWEVVVHHFLPTLRGPDLNPRASPSYKGGREMKCSLTVRLEELDLVTFSLCHRRKI